MSFPWASLMALGLRELRLSPDEFWRLSPRELFACLGGSPQQGLPRAVLNELMEQFPDEQGS